MPKIAICVCTCRRPQMLRSCLASLVGQAPIDGVDAKIIVIDNEAEGSKDARSAAQDYNALYIHEPRRGIPQARNAALTAARGIGATHVAFIDDDEEASYSWLYRLWISMKECGADAIQGPVHYRYPEDAQPWRCRSGWGTIKLATGTTLQTCATNNVLFDMAKADGLMFDDSHQFSGGEDIKFFYAFYDRGGCIAFCKEAVVYETVPWDRLTLKSNIRKSFSKGICAVRDARSRDRRYRPPYWELIRRSAMGVIKIAVAPLVMPFSPNIGLHAIMSGARHISYAAGVAAGLRNRTFDYYAKPTGY